MAAADNQNKTGFATSTVVLCGLAVIVFVYAISLFIEGGYNAAMSREYQVKVYEAGANEDLAATRAAQRDILDGPVRWLDREQGVVAMPIEQAMVRIVEESQGE